MATRIIFLCLLAAVNCSTLRQSDEAKADLEEYIQQAKLSINPRYRLHYHVAAPVGWVNDPNGFSYYQGNYHLFYQFYPYDSVWGPMHWGHATSPDLVNWTQQPTALLPEREQCFSGSAVVDGDTLYLVYTGHVITDTEPFFNQTQYLAYSDNGVDFHKYEKNPVLVNPDAPDFRDPKVWRHEDYWYAVIGSKTTDDRGRVLLYRSKNLIDWSFLNVLAESQGNLGYMWECPDFFELNGKHVLLMSPQGIEPQGDRYKNTHQTGYIVGTFDYQTHAFIPESEFQELDYGHDFYAAQTTEANGRRVLVGWFGMWEVPHPEDVDGWANAMTMVRELTLDTENRLLMTPVNETLALRDSVFNMKEFRQGQSADFGQAAEITIEGDLKKDIHLVFEGRSGGGSVELRWDVESAKVVVDRGNGDIRQVEWVAKKSRAWTIYLDTSSIELYCGIGEVVFSSRVYPLGGWKMTSQSEQKLKIKAYSLKRSVPE